MAMVPKHLRQQLLLFGSTISTSRPDPGLGLDHRLAAHPPQANNARFLFPTNSSFPGSAVAHGIRPMYFGRFILFVTAVLSFHVFPLPLKAQRSDVPHPQSLRAKTDKAEIVRLRDFRQTIASNPYVQRIRTLRLPARTPSVLLWSERDSHGSMVEMSAISLDGRSVAGVSEAPYLVKLRFAEFDPLFTVPSVPEELQARDAGYDRQGTFIVQFVTKPLQEFRDLIRSNGGRILKYVPDGAYLVRLDPAAFARVSRLPFVRWVGRYEPAYKVDEEVLARLISGESEPSRFNIMLVERGGKHLRQVADNIGSSGGMVHAFFEEGYRIEATLDAVQLFELLHHEDVLFVDRWAPPGNDMDLVRSTGGANLIESLLGYTGSGVRGEVMDNGLRQTHVDFQSGNPPLIHNSSNTNEPENHGTSTYGINFGRGTSNPTGRGMVPDAQGIFADYDFLTNRYTHTAQLNQAPFNAVYQSNSWGTGLTVNYTTISAEMDDILFQNDILILNSQSNTGNRSSRPQAWAKNIIGVGGIHHFETTSFSDDRWNGTASHGPAADGRLKPDLAYFYDSIFTTDFSSNSSYTGGFGGTSAATAMTAGHAGIFYQMWHNGLFGNPTGASVFESRPHMTTAKAVLINTAIQWDMTIPGTDITRDKQGFGRASLENLYNLRQKMLVVNETAVLSELASNTHFVVVENGSAFPLKITMTYADPMGNPAASQARINDLDLKVTAPNGTIYWGNNGLGTGMWSSPGGSPNTVDTVENVFVQTPAAGVWRIDVIAAELNEDARLETPGVIDADYALVASGIDPLEPTAGPVSIAGRVVSPNGFGIGGAVVSLAGPDGQLLTAITAAFGYFRFDGLEAGQTYVIGVKAKRRTFEPSELAVTPNDDVADLLFTSID